MAFELLDAEIVDGIFTTEAQGHGEKPG